MRFVATIVDNKDFRLLISNFLIRDYRSRNKPNINFFLYVCLFLTVALANVFYAISRENMCTVFDYTHLISFIDL